MPELKFSKMKQAGRYIKAKGDKDADYENPLQMQCEEYLRIRGLPFIRIPDSVLATVRNSRNHKDKRDVTKYLAGLPDLTVFFLSGRYVGIELKTRSKQTTAQKRWQRQIGDNYMIVRSFDAFVMLINTLMGSEAQ